MIGCLGSTAHWKDPQENEPEIFSSCDGCGEPIVEGDDMCDWGSVMLHDDIDCITNYVRNNSVRKVAGNEGD